VDRFEVAESFNRVCMAIEDLIACSPESFAETFERLNQATLRAWPDEGIQVNKMHAPTIEFQDLFKAWLFHCRGLSRTNVQSEARAWVDRFDKHLQAHQINIALGNCVQSKLMRRMPLVGGEIGSQSATNRDFGLFQTNSSESPKIQTNSNESPKNQPNTVKAEENKTATKNEIARLFKRDGKHPNPDHVAKTLRIAKCPSKSVSSHANATQLFNLDEALRIIEKNKPDWKLIEKE